MEDELWKFACEVEDIIRDFDADLKLIKNFILEINSHKKKLQ